MSRSWTGNETSVENFYVKIFAMNEGAYEAAAAAISKTYVQQGKDARRTHEKHIQALLQQV